MALSANPWIKTLTLLCLMTGEPAAAAGEFLSIKFSSKNQLRTGMTWIKFKPQLVQPKEQGGLFRRSKRPSQALSEEKLQALPYAATGKLFYTHNNGRVANCGAIFADDKLVLAPASCVMSEDGDWNSDFIFIRSFGTESQEIYAVQCVVIPRDWGVVIEGTPDIDYALLKTNRKSRPGHMLIAKSTPQSGLSLLGYSGTVGKGRVLTEKVLALESAADNAITVSGQDIDETARGAAIVKGKALAGMTTAFSTTVSGPVISPRIAPIASYARNGCSY